jgi:hypothetical protein
MRSVLLYISMVGLPIVGMVAALHLGRGLAAPASVAGVWRVELVEPAGGIQRCNEAAAPAPPSLQIIQSGRRIAISVGEEKKVAAVGEIREATLTAAGDSLQVKARLHREGDRTRLQGFISLKVCGKPAEIEFHAAPAPKRIMEEH